MIEAKRSFIRGSIVKRIKKYIIIIFILAIVALSRLIYNFMTSPKYIYEKNKPELEAAVQQIMETGETQGIEIPGVKRIAYLDAEHPIIEFYVKGFGLVPSSTYIGFYYSVDGVPMPCFSVNETLVEKGDAWEWKQPDGDNHGETKHMEGKWYTYKASY